MNFWQILVFPKDFHDLCHFCSFSGRFSEEVTLPLSAARSFQKVLPCPECDVSKTTECFAKNNFNAKDLSLVLTGWKVSKYRAFSGPYMPVSGLNTETYGVNLRFQFKYGKYEAEATPNSDTSRNGSFSARMNSANFSLMFLQYFNNPLGWSHENRTIY